MKFEETFEFDHTADVIMRMFTDEDYFLTKYERLGNRKPELVDSEKGEDRFSITVRHALDAEQLAMPDFIRKRLGDRVMLRQTDAWDIAARQGRIDIDIEKTPVDIAIDMTLTESGGKARLELAFDITADVPLLGGKVEKTVAGPITKRMKRDLEISNDMASDYAAS